MFENIGCRYTLISTEMYNDKRAKQVQAKRTLRLLGAPDILEVKGKFKTTETINKGATQGSRKGKSVKFGLHPN